ncbi:hypothetical protein F4V43_16530 [Paenibacillus spiritus]|uniref:Uncharacterized protein n=1 Tax=Paenibacillus spiritus TaxID=2496557 RepID=A0A5J5FWP1_9BACL|nr:MULTISPECIES: hypothetical protein [Paenibacillus]KAA8998358.1 hypothetical protein F4V43_16530 [Paenibacillus spiritus]
MKVLMIMPLGLASLLVFWQKTIEIKVYNDRLEYKSYRKKEVILYSHIASFREEEMNIITREGTEVRLPTLLKNQKHLRELIQSNMNNS